MLRLLVPLCLSTLTLAQDYYAAALNAAQEVPPTASTGRGFGIVRHDTATNNVRIFVWFDGLTGAPTGCHLHLGATGVNGGIIIGLAPASPDTFTGVGVVTPAQAAALGSSGTYLNLHSTAFGPGEIRGQVVPASSTRFTALLSGTQEVPPTPSAATGTLIAFLHQPESRVVYMANTTGVAPTAAHFHQAPAGMNGGVVVSLNGAGGSYCGVSNPLTAAQVSALLANGFYMNVHSAAFPGGEIRGQLIKDLGDHFVGNLDGLQEVPPNPTPGLGGANVVVAPDGTVNISGAYAGLTGPVLAAHVHLGPIGVAGGVVFPLAFGGGTFSASYSATTSELTDLRSGLWYVNLHTAAFGGGEIRGQLLPAKLPTTFGAGCLGSNGVRPQIGARGFPSVGAPMNIDMYGGIPTLPVLFAFGTNRDQLGPIPLPLELPIAGIPSPDCYLFLDPIITLVAFNNVLGCATQPLTVTFNPSLRGAVGYAQWFALDPAANPGAFVASSALTLPIQ